MDSYEDTLAFDEDIYGTSSSSSYQMEGRDESGSAKGSGEDDQNTGTLSYLPLNPDLYPILSNHLLLLFYI
jgi:hypothetical protein